MSPARFTAALYPVAAAMAGSRVYLGVHYPSDILAGALLGTLVGGATR
jgi:undecaprenyl-diphosphatase